MSDTKIPGELAPYGPFFGSLGVTFAMIVSYSHQHKVYPYSFVFSSRQQVGLVLTPRFVSGN